MIAAGTISVPIGAGCVAAILRRARRGQGVRVIAVVLPNAGRSNVTTAGTAIARHTGAMPASLARSLMVVVACGTRHACHAAAVMACGGRR